MNEVEWLASTDLHKMLEHLSGQVSDRKLRLFACACCRAMDRGGNTSGLAVVEMAEQVADGLRPLGEAVRLESSVRRLMADTRALEADLSLVARWFACEALAWRHLPQAAVLRCIAGNPFRKVSIDPGWLAWDGGVVRNLAQSIYDGRALDRLGILADALEEAGCTDEDILAHLRDPGPHAHGCWVVDIILAKDR